MDERRSANGYHGRAAHAVTAVLVEIGQVLGAFHDKFVVLGGAVPWLLLREAEPPHIGTIDIDLDLDPAALGDGEYVRLVEALEAAGYERGGEGLRRFQMSRTVQIDSGAPVVVIVDFLMPRESKPRKNTPELLEGFAVQKADGAAIALQCNTDFTIEGRMPDGRRNSVRLLVATIPALLVMKGFALVGRDKWKDAYDIYYSVRHFPEGIDALAVQCAALMDSPIARRGFENIASKFRSADDFGPQTIAAFIGEMEWAGMTKEQITEDSFRQVSALLGKIGIAQ